MGKNDSSVSHDVTVQLHSAKCLSILLYGVETRTSAKQEQLHGGSVRVEANPLSLVNFLLQMHNKKWFDLEDKS